MKPRLLILTAASSALLCAACGDDQSSQLAADITQSLPGQYAAEQGTTGTATVDDMTCSETGDSQAYVCIGDVDIADDSGVTTYQTQIAATWDTNTDTGTWHVTSSLPQS